MKSKFYSYLFILIFICSMCAWNQGLSQNVSPNPTRPSASDNAYLTHLGYTELEFGLSSQKNFSTLPTLLKFSFYKTMEIGFLMSGLLSHSGSENEIGDPGLQLKTKLIDQNWGAFALTGRIERAKNSRPKSTIYAVGSFPLNYISIDGTLGAAFFEQGNGDYANSVQFAVSFNSNFDGLVGGFLEFFGEDSDYFSPFYFDGGLSYAISSKTVVDCSATLGLNDDAADWILQVGFTTVLFKLLK